MLLPGKNREFFMLNSGNKSESLFVKPIMQNIIVINEGFNGRVQEKIHCISGSYSQTINIFDPAKGTWTFQPITDSLELEKYLRTASYSNSYLCN